jgi:hypothetical protein
MIGKKLSFGAKTKMNSKLKTPVPNAYNADKYYLEVGIQHSFGIKPAIKNKCVLRPLMRELTTAT